MTAALELLVSIGVFALAIGLLGTFMASSEEKNRKRVAEQEGRRLSRQPWDAHSSRGRGNR